MLNKYRIMMIVVLSIFLGIPHIAGAAKAPMKVYIEGSLIKLAKDPIVVNGVTMVPFRPIFEKLGLMISWNQLSGTITGTRDGLEIELVVGEKTAIVNGEERKLSFSPISIYGNTFVPLRFISEATGNDVSWDKTANAIKIAAPPLFFQDRSSSMEVTKGSTTSLQAASKKYDLNRVAITWKSSNNKVATVDGQGKVTAIETGRTKITASLNGNINAVITVDVVGPQPKDAQINKSLLTIDTGASEQLSIRVAGEDKSTAAELGYDVQWSSDNKKVAVIAADGTVTGVAPGKTVVKGTINKTIVLKCIVIVEEAKKVEPNLDETPAAPEVDQQEMPISNPAKENEINVPTVQPPVSAQEKPLTLEEVAASKDIKQFAKYLNQNYASLPSPIGDWEPKFEINYTSIGNPVYHITMEWGRPSPHTLVLDDPGMDNILYGRVITQEEKLHTKRMLRDFQKQIAGLAEQIFPETRFRGEFRRGHYKYPNLRMGYNYIKFLSWSNYNEESKEQEFTGFQWNLNDNNMNLVVDMPLSKIMFYDETTGTAYEKYSPFTIIKIKVGESKAIKLAVEPIEMNDSGLSYHEMGLSFTTGYDSNPIVSVDKNGVVTGLRKGQKGISIISHLQPLITHYVTIVVE